MLASKISPGSSVGWYAYVHLDCLHLDCRQKGYIRDGRSKNGRPPGCRAARLGVVLKTSAAARRARGALYLEPARRRGFHNARGFCICGLALLAHHVATPLKLGTLLLRVRFSSRSSSTLLSSSFSDAASCMVWCAVSQALDMAAIKYTFGLLRVGTCMTSSAIGTKL
ncbi:hypothetical protein BC567DRAFT_42263 [Phyllosticta citribraziliensis]